MANHPNRSRKFIAIKGRTMTDGYYDDYGPRRLYLAMGRDGQFYPYDIDMQAIDRRDGPVSIDRDGLITHDGAWAGYGFAPDRGEIERLAAQFIYVPCAA
jgi:hypothetical protein